MLPIIVQSRIADMVGASNMQQIIQNKFATLKKAETSNQFKMFILLFTLADIDLVKNYSFINESVTYIKIPVLRYSILMKILYYYNFRLTEYSEQTKSKIKRNLQNSFADVGVKYNDKMYSKDKVSKAFQSFDRIKHVEVTKRIN
jgi:hypothetical protein